MTAFLQSCRCSKGAASNLFASVAHNRRDLIESFTDAQIAGGLAELLPCLSQLCEFFLKVIFCPAIALSLKILNKKVTIQSPVLLFGCPHSYQFMVFFILHLSNCILSLWPCVMLRVWVLARLWALPLSDIFSRSKSLHSVIPPGDLHYKVDVNGEIETVLVVWFKHILHSINGRDLKAPTAIPGNKVRS